ncbi:FixH family protein [Halobacillus sp. A5]|uniref:FixH family protein n=1 Tax=Halobacillus sp. A5 TaxID=2880263 RepID=UPI0020A62C72|nr:FixH family protein [Halobacillus sp. A5]MCP3027783.1 FixH family protein [Halobacillus sp. A5]
MKKILCTSLIIVMMLTGCSLKQDADSLYNTETPLDADIMIPESIKINEKEEIKVILTQGGHRVKDADFVHVEIWKQDGSVSYRMEEAMNNGDGVYILRKELDSEGLYYAKLHAGNDGSVIVPQKQFIVGELSSSEIDALKEDLPKQNANQEPHH